MATRLRAANCTEHRKEYSEVFVYFVKSILLRKLTIDDRDELIHFSQRLPFSDNLKQRARLVNQ